MASPKDKSSLLIADEDPVSRRRIREALKHQGFVVKEASSLTGALGKCRADSFDIIITELWLHSEKTAPAVRAFKMLQPNAKVIVLTGVSSVENAVDAFRNGASDYVVKPVIPEQIIASLHNVHLERIMETGKQKIPVQLMDVPRSVLNRDATQLPKKILGIFLEFLHSHMGCVTVDPEGKRWVRQGVSESYRRRWFAYLENRVKQPLDEVSDLIALRSCRLDPKGKRWHLLYVPLLVERISQGGCLMLRDGNQRFFSKKEQGQVRFIASHIAISWPKPTEYTDFLSLAYFDPLTGLLNTRFLDLALEKEMTHSKRQHSHFSILFIDLDLFKEVTDGYGHLMGGKVLREFAEVLQKAVRDQDLVFRFGGDEYVVLLTQATHSIALKIAERIRSAIERHRFLSREGINVSLTASTGVASYPDHAAKRRDLLHVADQAMYLAKKFSRNSVVSADKVEES
ncbi:MAG: diguanylate cyclase [Deltaproteobacteria bacterium]|nr:diguanylate cyclase [Deltaproteobacteria bacterium]